MSIHWDRLDVKVAVRYPKTYGPRGGKGKGKGKGRDSMEDEDAEKVGAFVSCHVMSCVFSLSPPV